MSTAPKSIPTSHLPVDDVKDFEKIKKADLELLASGTRKAATGIDEAAAKAALEAMRIAPATAALDLTNKSIVATDSPELFRAGLMGDGIVLQSNLYDKTNPMAGVLDGRKGSHSIIMVHSEGADKAKIDEARTRVIDGSKELADKDAKDAAGNDLKQDARADALAEKLKGKLDKKEEVSFVACEIKDDKLMVEKAGKHCVVYVINPDGSVAATTKKGALTREPAITNKKGSEVVETIPLDLKANQVVVVIDGDIAENALRNAVKEAGGNLALVMAKLVAGKKNVSDTGIDTNPDKPLNISLYIHKPSEPNEALNTKPDIVEKEKKAVAVTRTNLREALNLAREQVENLDPFLRPSREEVRSANTRQEREAYVAAHPAEFDTVEKQKAYIEGPKEKGLRGMWNSLTAKWKNSVGIGAKLDTIANGVVAGVDSVLFRLPSFIGKSINELGEKIREGLWSFAESRESTTAKVVARALAYTVGEGAHIALGIAGTVPRVAGVIGSYVLNLVTGTAKDLVFKGILFGRFGRENKKKSLESVFNLEEFFKTNKDLEALYKKLGEIDPQAQVNLLRQLQEKSNEVRRTQAKQAWDEEHSPEREFTQIKKFDELHTKGVAKRYAEPRGRISEFLVNGNKGWMVGPFKFAFPGFAKIPLFRDLLFRREPQYANDGKFVRDSEGHVRQDFLLDPSIGRAVKELLVKTDALADRWDAARRVDMAEAENGLHPDEMRREMMRIMREFSDETLASKNEKQAEARAVRKLLDSDTNINTNLASALAPLSAVRQVRDNAQCKELVNKLLPGVDAAFRQFATKANLAIRYDDMTDPSGTGKTDYELAKEDVEKVVSEIRAIKSHADIVALSPTIEAEIDTYLAQLEANLKKIDESVKARLGVLFTPELDTVFSSLPDAATRAQLHAAVSNTFSQFLPGAFNTLKGINTSDAAARASADASMATAFTNLENNIVTELKTNYGIADAEATAFAAKLKAVLEARWTVLSTEAELTQARAADKAYQAVDQSIHETVNHTATLTPIAEKGVSDSLDTYEKFLEKIVAARAKGSDETYTEVATFGTDLEKIITDMRASHPMMPAAVIQELRGLHLKLTRQAERVASLRDRTVDTYDRGEWVGSVMTGLDKSGLSELAKTMRDRFALMTGKAAAKKLAFAPSLSVLAVAAVSTAAGKVAAARVHEGVRDALFSKFDAADKDATVFMPLVAPIVAKGKFLGMPVPEGIGEMLAKATTASDEDKATRAKAAKQLENWVARVLSNVVDGQGVTKLADELRALVPAAPTVPFMIPDPSDPTGATMMRHPEWATFIDSGVSQSVATVVSRLISGISANRIAVKEDLLGSITSRGAGAAVVDQLYDHLRAVELVLTNTKIAELQKERVLAQAGIGQAAKAAFNAILGGAKDMVFNPLETGTQVAGAALYSGPAMLVDTAVLHYVANGVQHGLNLAHLPHLAAAYGGMVHVAEAPAHVLGSMGPDSIAHGLDVLTGQPVAARDAGPVQVLREIGHQLAIDAQASGTPRVARVLDYLAGAGAAAHPDTARAQNQPANNPNGTPNAPLQPVAPGATPSHGPNQPGAQATGPDNGSTPNNTPSGDRTTTPGTTPNTPGQTATPSGDRSADGEPVAPAERPAPANNNTEGYLEAGTVTASNSGRGREGRMMAVLDARYPDLSDHQRNYIANSLQNNRAVHDALHQAHQGHSRPGDQIDVRIEGDNVHVRFHRPAGHGHAESTADATVPLSGLLGNTHLRPTDRTQMQAVLSGAPVPTTTAPAAAGSTTTGNRDSQHGSHGGRHGRHGGDHTGSGTGSANHREGQTERQQDRPAPSAEVSPVGPDALTAEATTNLVTYLRSAVTATGVTMQAAANQPGRIEVSYGSPARTFNINVQYHPSTGQVETLTQGIPENDNAALDAYNRVNARIMQVYATRHSVLERLRGLNRTGVTFGATERPNEVQVMYRDSAGALRNGTFAIVQRDNGNVEFTTVPGGTNMADANAVALMRDVANAINQTIPTIRQDLTNQEAAIDSGERSEVIDTLRSELDGMDNEGYRGTISDLEAERVTTLEDDERAEVEHNLTEARKGIVIEPANGIQGGINVTYSDAQGVRQTLTYRVTRDGERVVLYSPNTTDANRETNTRVRQAILNFMNDGEVTIQEETTPTTTAVRPAQVAAATPAPTSTPAPTNGPQRPTQSPTPANPVPAAPAAARDALPNAATTVNGVAAQATDPTTAVRGALSSLTNQTVNAAPNTSRPAPSTVRQAATVADNAPTPENPAADINPDDPNGDDLPGDDDATPPAPTGGPDRPRPTSGNGSGGTNATGDRTRTSSVAGFRQATDTERPAAAARATIEARRNVVGGSSEIRPVETSVVTVDLPDPHAARPAVEPGEVGHPSSLTLRQASVEAYNQEPAIREHLRLTTRVGRAGLIDIQGAGDHTTDRITVMTHPEADGSLRVIRVVAANGTAFADDAAHRNAALADKPLREVLAVLSARVAPQSEAAIRANTDSLVITHIVRTRTEAYRSDREAAGNGVHFEGLVTTTELEHEFSNADSRAVGTWLDGVNSETAIATVRSDLQGSGYLMDQIRAFVATTHNPNRVSFDQYPWARNISEERVLRAVVSAINDDGSLTTKDLASSLGIPYGSDTTAPEMQTFLRPLREIAEYAGLHLKLTPQLASNSESGDQLEERRAAHSEVDIDDPEDIYERGGADRATAVILALADIDSNETIRTPRDLTHVDSDEVIRTNQNTVVTEADVRTRLDRLRQSHSTGVNTFDDNALLADIELLRQSGERYLNSDAARSNRLEIPEGRNSAITFADSLEHSIDERQMMAVRYGIAMAMQRGVPIVRAVAGLREVAAREAAPHNAAGRVETTLSQAERTLIHEVANSLPEQADLQSYSTEQLQQLATSLRDRINAANAARRAIPAAELPLLGRVVAITAEREVLTANADQISQQIADRINAAHNNDPEMAVSAARIREQLLHFGAGVAFRNTTFQGAGIGFSKEFSFDSDNGRHNFTFGLDVGVGGSPDAIAVGGGAHANYTFRITRGVDLIAGAVAGAGTVNLNPGVAAGLYLGARAHISGGWDGVLLGNVTASLTGVPGVSFGALLGVNYNPAHAYESMVEDLRRETGATIRPEDGPTAEVQNRVVARYGIAAEENAAQVLANREEVARRYRLIYEGLENTSLEGAVRNGFTGAGVGVGMINGIPTFGPYIRLTFGAGTYVEIRQASDGQLHHAFHDAFQEAVRAASRNQSENGTTTVVTRMNREVVAPQLGTDHAGQAHVISGTGHIRETVLGGVTDNSARERAINAAMSGAHLHLNGNRISISSPSESTEYRIVNAGVPGLTLTAAPDGTSAELVLPSGNNFTVVNVHTQGLDPNAANQTERQIIMFCPSSMTAAEMEAAAEEATFRTREFVAIEHLHGTAHFTSGRYDTRDQAAPTTTVASTAPEVASDLPTANRDNALTNEEMGDFEALDAQATPEQNRLAAAVYQYIVSHPNHLSAFRNHSDLPNGQERRVAGHRAPRHAPTTPATVEAQRLQTEAARLQVIHHLLNQADFPLRGQSFGEGYNMDNLLDQLTDAANLTDISNRSVAQQRQAVVRRLGLETDNFAAIHPNGNAAAQAGIRESNTRMRAAAASMPRIGEAAVAGLTEYTEATLAPRHLERTEAGSDGYIVVGREQGGFTRRRVPGGAAIITMAEHYDLQRGQRDGQAMSDNEKEMARMFLRETYDQNDALVQSNALYLAMLTPAEREVLAAAGRMRHQIQTETLGRMPAGSTHAARVAAVAGALEQNQAYQALIHGTEYVRLTTNRTRFAENIHTQLIAGTPNFTVTMPGNRVYTINLNARLTRGIFVADANPDTHPNVGHCGNEFVSSRVNLTLTQAGEVVVRGNSPISLDLEIPRDAQVHLDAGTSINLGGVVGVESTPPPPGRSHPDGGGDRTRTSHPNGGGSSDSIPRPGDNTPGARIDGTPPATPNSGTPGTTPQGTSTPSPQGSRF